MASALPGSRGEPRASELLRSLAAALLLAWAPPGTASDAPAPEDEEAAPWALQGEVDYFALPGATDYVVAIAVADRERLHLEARYNSEDLRTLSTFVGLNLGFGEKLRLELTPMVGGLVGRTCGLAPGLTLDASWWKLELYSEVLYVVDLGEPSDSTLNTWTELSLWPVEWARGGVVVQRTKPIQTGFDVERGLFAGLSYRRVAVTAHFLNPGSERAYTVFMLGLEL